MGLVQHVTIRSTVLLSANPLSSAASLHDKSRWTVKGKLKNGWFREFALGTENASLFCSTADHRRMSWLSSSSTLSLLTSIISRTLVGYPPPRILYNYIVLQHRFALSLSVLIAAGILCEPCVRAINFRAAGHNITNTSSCVTRYQKRKEAVIVTSARGWPETSWEKSRTPFDFAATSTGRGA